MTKHSEKWLANSKEGKEAGRKIDPETAEVTWIFAQDFDHFGVDPELPVESQQVRGSYFARSPGPWVWFGDLPAATWDALWNKHKASLVFPAGLPIEFFAGRHKEQDQDA
jgi:hypothetical protein